MAGPWLFPIPADTLTCLEFIPGSDKMAVCVEFGCFYVNCCIPRMASDNPYQAPELGVPVTEAADRDHLRAVARAQRHAMLAAFCYIALVVLFLFSMSRSPIPLLAARAVAICALGILVYGAISVFQLAAMFRGKVVAVIYVIGIIVPLLGLLLLLSVSQKATSLLRENGIHVGFLGANPNSI